MTAVYIIIGIILFLCFCDWITGPGESTFEVGDVFEYGNSPAEYVRMTVLYKDQERELVRWSSDWYVNGVNVEHKVMVSEYGDFLMYVNLNFARKL